MASSKASRLQLPLPHEKGWVSEGVEKGIEPLYIMPLGKPA